MVDFYEISELVIRSSQLHVEQVFRCSDLISVCQSACSNVSSTPVLVNQTSCAFCMVFISCKPRFTPSFSIWANDTEFRLPSKSLVQLVPLKMLIISAWPIVVSSATVAYACQIVCSLLPLIHMVRHNSENDTLLPDCIHCLRTQVAWTFLSMLTELLRMNP